MAKNCSFYFWDVQHGHATYVNTPNGRHIAVDMGSGDYSSKDEAFSPLRMLSQDWGVKRLDYLVVTHPHLDHIDDILNLEGMEPKVFLRPKHIENVEVLKNVRAQDKEKFLAYCDLNSRYNRTIEPTSEDAVDNPANWGGLEIKSFVPTDCDHSNFNNHSVVVVFEFAGSKVVVPGDNEKDSFVELMELASFKKAVQDADVLLAPHHGRESGYVKEFVSLVNPKVTIVSDGRFCDTSANPRYSAQSSGWTTHYRSGKSKAVRKCLTTNSDGHIKVTLGYNEDAPFLEIEAD